MGLQTYEMAIINEKQNHFVIRLNETINTTKQEEKKFIFFRQVLGAIRIMHILPVFSVTAIIGVLTYFSLGEFNPKGAFVLMVLTIFFQEAFTGGQNDYLDQDMDKLYGKNKAIPIGLINRDAAFWVIVANYFIFTGLSIGLGHYVNIGYWVVLYIQAANFVCMIYNIVVKDTPFSLIPFLIAFPAAPILVWLCFGGFNLIQLWYIPMILCISISGHIANELPDFEKDKENNNRNFVVFIGKKIATIIYLIVALLTEMIVIIPYFIHELNRTVFLIVMGVSSYIGIASIFVLWIEKWKTTELVFGFFTAFFGANAIGLIVLLNV
ncbi:MAG: hypothetical protein FK730_12825 [Asgard group archaeon]|nr:hypothetical protein [Asgard group archaeon]